MSVGLLGKKIGMTQVYEKDGKVVPVTVIQAGPCPVLLVRTKDRDGYEAVQIGFEERLSEKDLKRPKDQRKRSRVPRAERGQFVALSSKRSKAAKEGGKPPVPKADCEPMRYIKEFRTEGVTHDCEVGKLLTVAQFDGMKALDVTGTSKGRGTAGVMKRWNYSGQRATHGVKKCHRHSGGIGARTDPSRVWKGKKMAGHYGHARSTSRNLRLIQVDGENNTLLVRGAVPGPIGGYVMVIQAKSNKKSKA